MLAFRGRWWERQGLIRSPRSCQDGGFLGASAFLLASVPKWEKQHHLGPGGTQDMLLLTGRS